MERIEEMMVDLNVRLAKRNSTYRINDISGSEFLVKDEKNKKFFYYDIETNEITFYHDDDYMTHCHELTENDFKAMLVFHVFDTNINRYEEGGA